MILTLSYVNSVNEMKNNGRNCLECKERSRGDYGLSSKMSGDQSSSSSRNISRPSSGSTNSGNNILKNAANSQRTILESLASASSPVKDPEKLLQVKIIFFC